MKPSLIKFIGIVFILNILSCKKDIPIDANNPPCQSNPTADNCPQLYDQRSEPYLNLYTGTLFTQCTALPTHQYPDKYSYWHLCVNPKNPYEIAYLRRENGVQADDDMDLYKYNFCSGKSTLITNHVAYSPDWSIKDWIIYTGTDRNLWKIKSNGDSLTQLTFTGSFQNNAQWNPSGNKYIWNGSQIANENGNLLKTLGLVAYSYTWLNDSIILFNEGNNPTENLNIEKFNINTDVRELLISEPKNGLAVLFSYDKKFNSFYFIKSIAEKRQLSRYSFTTNTVQVVELTEQSNLKSFCNHLENNKVIVRQILRDTLTGNPCVLNFRSHIAIMEMDGSNLRRIKLPE